MAQRVEKQVAEFKAWHPRVEDGLSTMVAQTKFDEWLKSEFEPVQHQSKLAVPRSEFVKFVKHMGELESQLIETRDTTSIRPGSAAATGDQSMKEPLLGPSGRPENPLLKLGHPRTPRNVGIERPPAPPV